MRIVGFLVVGPNEKYLEKSLDEFKRLCDDAVIVTNNADQRTKDLIKSYSYWQYEDNREWGIHQPTIKTDLLKKIGLLNPDWIIALDADERFAPEFTREEAERLANTNEIAFYFQVINLYDDPDHYAHSTGVQRFWNIRFYKFLPQHGLEFQKKNLHCGLAPPIAYNYGWYAPYYLEHYGLMLKEDRDRKVARYQKFDPQAKWKSKEYYDDLARELKPIPFDRKQILNRLAEEIKSIERKTPKPKTEQFMKYFYLKRLKDGQVMAIPERDVPDTLKQGFEMVGPVEEEVQPVQTQEKEVTFTCPLCGKILQTEKLLKMHKGRMHK